MSTDPQMPYLEFPAADLDAVQSFYEKAFQWSFTAYGPDYLAFAGDKIHGGFYRADMKSTRDRGAALIVLYSAELETTLETVESAGGTIVEGIFSFPGGRRFHFGDPNGNELAVWSDH